MSKRTIQERITEAYTFANRWLGDANDAQEAGNSKKAEKCEQKAQYWLDILNKLEGFNDVGEPSPAQPEPAPEVVYTDPVTTADGETIKARITVRGEYDYLIELLVNDIVDHGASEIGSTRRYAMLRANDMVAKRKIAIDSPFNPRRHRTLTPVATISLKTGRLIEATEDIKAQRAAYLRRQIERTESELASLRFELSELE